jgi:hypothetical protein
MSNEFGWHLRKRHEQYIWADSPKTRVLHLEVMIFALGEDIYESRLRTFITERLIVISSTSNI